MLSTAYIDGLNCIADPKAGVAGPASVAGEGARGGPSPIQPLGRNTLSTTNGRDPASTLGTVEWHGPMPPLPLAPLMPPEPDAALPECEAVPLVEPAPLPVATAPDIAPLPGEPVPAPVPLADVEPLLPEEGLDAHDANPPRRNVAATDAKAPQKNR